MSHTVVITQKVARSVLSNGPTQKVTTEKTFDTLPDAERYAEIARKLSRPGSVVKIRADA